MPDAPKYPPPRVLDAFGATSTPVHLAGGGGTSYRAGNLVLKPILMESQAYEDEISCSASVLNSMSRTEFRSPRYIASKSGSWVVDGWYALDWVEGSHDSSPSKWKRVIEACCVFHAALRGIPRPNFLDRRTDAWTIADRVTWGEAPLVCHPALRDPLERLSTVVRAVELPNQVIHGDFTGNVLFAPGLPPAIIDFSPYWRPAEFALAIVVVDALVWEDADVSILDYVSGVAEIEQMLVRAEMRRLLEIDCHHRMCGKDTLGQVRAHLSTVDLVSELAAAT